MVLSITMETNPRIGLWEFLHWINWGGKTNTKCLSTDYMGWHPGEHRKENVSWVLYPSLSWMDAMGPDAPSSCCHTSSTKMDCALELWAKINFSSLNFSCRHIPCYFIENHHWQFPFTCFFLVCSSYYLHTPKFPISTSLLNLNWHTFSWLIMLKTSILKYVKIT